MNNDDWAAGQLLGPADPKPQALQAGDFPRVVCSPLAANFVSSCTSSMGQSDSLQMSELGTDGVPSQLSPLVDRVQDSSEVLVTGSLVSIDPAAAYFDNVVTDPEHDMVLVTDSLVSLNPAAAPFVMSGNVLGAGGLVSLDPVAAPLVTSDQGMSGEHYQHLAVGGGQAEGLQEHEVVMSSEATMLREHSEILPLVGVDDIPELFGIAPKDLHKVSQLENLVVQLPRVNFSDKVLPASKHSLSVNEVFTPEYFVALHNITSAAGYREDGSHFTENTPNYLGARVSLPHTKLRLDRWRHHLIGYESVELCQLLEFGFPVGVDPGQDLECKTRNHGSSYMWYSSVDKFVAKEVSECGISGPLCQAPWEGIVVSPLMTAHKKPRGRRTVFDATYGELSVNNATPGDHYLGEPTAYTFPKVEDYRQLVLQEGCGCFMWKRDLSRFFLQLPMDPVDYIKVGMVWRGLIFFFVALAFGLRHSGLNGQRVTDATAWIHRRLGLETPEEKPYNVENYVDDMGGAESTLARATAAFDALGWLLEDLGLSESRDKAVAPSTTMTYLGVEFDSVAMEMRVPADKLQEIKSEIRIWLRRKAITKKELQSLLGKLFWISKVVKHSRVFLGRMLEQLRSMTSLKDNKKTKLLDETRKDIRWWACFLEHYNGVQIITIEDPIKLTYEQLLDTPHEICAGDATPVGGGAWHGYEFWSSPLPDDLQDPTVPIHVKEFIVLIVFAKI